MLTTNTAAAAAGVEESTLTSSSSSPTLPLSLTLTGAQQQPTQPPTDLTIPPNSNSGDQQKCSDDLSSPSFEQLDNLAAQFSPILGEGEHLFSPEELAKVLFFTQSLVYIYKLSSVDNVQVFW